MSLFIRKLVIPALALFPEYLQPCVDVNPDLEMLVSFALIAKIVKKLVSHVMHFFKSTIKGIVLLYKWINVKNRDIKLEFNLGRFRLFKTQFQPMYSIDTFSENDFSGKSLR